jgi:hypothetical protein
VRLIAPPTTNSPTINHLGRGIFNSKKKKKGRGQTKKMGLPDRSREVHANEMK